MIQQYMEDSKLFPYTITVVRDNLKELGPGLLLAQYKGETIAEFPVITGGSQKDPTQYGGLTPPITWFPIEPFQLRSPDGVRPSLRMSRIVPASRTYANLFYSNRTYALPPERNDPFMIHLGSASIGSSTGCVVVVSSHDLFNDVISEMQAQSFMVPIHVKDWPDFESSMGR